MQIWDMGWYGDGFFKMYAWDIMRHYDTSIIINGHSLLYIAIQFLRGPTCIYQQFYHFMLFDFRQRCQGLIRSHLQPTFGGNIVVCVLMIVQLGWPCDPNRGDRGASPHCSEMLTLSPLSPLSPDRSLVRVILSYSWTFEISSFKTVLIWLELFCSLRALCVYLHVLATIMRFQFPVSLLENCRFSLQSCPFQSAGC